MRRKYQVGLSAVGLLGVVALFVIFQVLSIDWDIRQRRNQKTAFLLTRRLSVALETFRRTNGAYPAHIQSLHDDFVEVAISKDEYRDHDFAELSWQHVVDANHVFGYVYDYQPSGATKSGVTLFTHYVLHADPLERAKTGFKSFYVDDSGSIRWNDERQATSTDPVPDVDPILDMHSYWTECLRRWKQRT